VGCTARVVAIEKGFALTTATLDRTDLHTRLVEYHIRLTRADQLAHADRLDSLIGLRQTLRDLCVDAGAWEADLEQAHQADLAALRGLAHPAPNVDSFITLETVAA
jgi:hypothetical protein